MTDDSRVCQCGHPGWDHSQLGCGYLHGPDRTPCNRFEPAGDPEALLARIAADTGGEFVPCRFGDRVSTCYHVPRCSRLVPGYQGSPFGRYEPAEHTAPEQITGGE